MVNKEIIVTASGYKKLEEKLEQLKTVKRHDVTEKIKNAVSYGDITENSEYEDAKNEQAFVEGRILTIENMLRNAKVIKDDEVYTDKVSVGSTVELKDIEFDETVEYTIVGSTEADPSANLISNESPLGSAILGRKKNDIVDVNAPSGVVKYKILSIKKK
jgi:transcription elongation factor GreA